jgi:4-hydroxybenzoate polyprenyltransferase
MTFRELMREHHTILSLLLGGIITFAVFLIQKLNKILKVLIIFVLMFVLTGLIGVLKYLGLVAAGLRSSRW